MMEDEPVGNGLQEQECLTEGQSRKVLWKTFHRNEKISNSSFSSVIPDRMFLSTHFCFDEELGCRTKEYGLH
tara:strand:- start:207 stop:422 length:216 start_codon:yes stop_codon:yes gene_type:complete